MLFLKSGSGNDLVTELTANYAFLCFYSLLVKRIILLNPLIKFLLPPITLLFLNCCCFFQVFIHFLVGTNRK